MGKIKLLLYCTKQMPRLVFTDGKWWLDNSKENTYWKKRQIAPIGYNGKIIAECDYEVEEISKVKDIYDDDYFYDTPTLYYDELLEKSCLNNNQLEDYLEFNGYAIHIKNLHIFDDPRVISYYFNENEEYIEKAPQNMRTCYEYKYSGFETDIPISSKKYILISIRPEWLCKILNGEKTIEIRKKVLKEMI